MPDKDASLTTSAGATSSQFEPRNFDEALAHARGLLDGSAAAALDAAEALVRVRKDPRVYRLAAEACRRLGMTDEAVAAELAGIQAALADAELQRSALAGDDGQPRKALGIAEQFLRRQPDDLLAMTLAAEAAMSLWDLERSEIMLRSVLARAPTFLRASMLLGDCRARQVRMREAIAVLGEVVERKPDNVSALTHLAQLQAEIGDLEQTVVRHEKLVSLEPGNVERWIELAQYYRIVGRRDDSIRAFRHALGIDPGNGSAWWGLANYFAGDLDRGDEQAIRQAVEERAGTIQEGALHLALGLLADRAGDRPEAFGQFIAGKKIRLAYQPFDPEPITAAVDEVIRIFTPAFHDRRSLNGWPDPSPIFILGMPRSGTTLVERMLGRHSSIEAAGELQIMRRLSETARHRARKPENYAALLEGLSDPQLAWVGERYMSASRDYRHSDKPRFVDKNNLNWMHIALILLALPSARVIDMRRDALDCCWANFKMLFAEGFPAANDLRHVGRFYRDYVRLLEAMSRAAPGRILAVRYEDVVDDLEGSIRRILDFVGLPFETACLDFHLSTSAVATASSEQVRRPLNREGIGSAQPYKEWLGPLIEELGPLAAA
jgi:tetratricopeptide (TPR) repeat protein